MEPFIPGLSLAHIDIRKEILALRSLHHSLILNRHHDSLRIPLHLLLWADLLMLIYFVIEMLINT